MTTLRLRTCCTLLCALALLIAAGIARAADAPNITPMVTGPASGTIGTPFNYTLALANIGTAASRGTVTVTDALAPGLAINSVSTYLNFSCDIAGQTVTCTTKAPIAAGAANLPVATINVTPNAAGGVDNSISVAGGGDANTGDNKTWPITTSVASLPQFARAADGSGSATPVPALSPMMLMVLSVLLAFGSAMAMRTRKRA